MTISSVSSASAAYLQQTQAPKQQQSAPAASNEQQQDLVHLSAQAQSALSADPDHDGDNH